MHTAYVGMLTPNRINFKETDHDELSDETSYATLIVLSHFIDLWAVPCQNETLAKALEIPENAKNDPDRGPLLRRGETTPKDPLNA